MDFDFLHFKKISKSDLKFSKEERKKKAKRTQKKRRKEARTFMHMAVFAGHCIGPCTLVLEKTRQGDLGEGKGEANRNPRALEAASSPSAQRHRSQLTGQTRAHCLVELHPIP